jgi:hypothetical protein
MTAVFAPDPARLTGEVNVLLWFHGEKRYWQSDGKNGENFSGKSIQYGVWQRFATKWAIHTLTRETI